MDDSIILSLSMLGGTITILIGNVFLLMIDILYSLYKSKKTSKNQYWIVDIRYGCKQVNSMKEIVVYRLEIGLFTIVVLFLFYIGMLIYIKVK